MSRTELEETRGGGWRIKKPLLERKGRVSAESGINTAENSYLDAVILSRAYQYWLARDPLQRRNGTVMCSSYDMEEPTLVIQIPKRDMSCG